MALQKLGIFICPTCTPLSSALSAFTTRPVLICLMGVGALGGIYISAAAEELKP